MNRADIKTVVKLSFPISLSHLLNFAMQAVDTAFISPLGVSPLAGLSLGSAVFAVALVFGIGLISSLDYFVSYSVGSGNARHSVEYASQAIWVAFLYSVVATLGMLGLAHYPSILGIQPEIQDSFRNYLTWLALSMPPTLLFFAFRQYLQGHQITIFPMLLLVFANVLNVFLNWLWVPVYGVTGSAVSTLVCRVAEVIVLGIFVVHWNHGKFPGTSVFSRINWEKKKQVWKLGLPAAAYLLIEVSVFAASTLLAERKSPATLSAHHLVLQVASFLFMVPLGISAATAVLVGKAYGEKDHMGIRSLVRTALMGSALLMVALGFLMRFWFSQSFSSLAPSPEVFEMAVSLLALVVGFQVFDSTQVILGGALRGVSDTKSPLIANLCGHWLFGFPLATYLCLYTDLGARGIWIGLMSGLAAVSIVLWIRWRSVEHKLLGLG